MGGFYIYRRGSEKVKWKGEKGKGKGERNKNGKEGNRKWGKGKQGQGKGNHPHVSKMSLRKRSLPYDYGTESLNKYGKKYGFPVLISKKYTSY